MDFADGIIVFDAAGKLTRLNSSAKQLIKEIPAYASELPRDVPVSQLRDASDKVRSGGHRSEDAQFRSSGRTRIPDPRRNDPTNCLRRRSDGSVELVNQRVTRYTGLTAALKVMAAGGD